MLLSFSFSTGCLHFHLSVFAERHYFAFDLSPFIAISLVRFRHFDAALSPFFSIFDAFQPFSPFAVIILLSLSAFLRELHCLSTRYLRLFVFVHIFDGDAAPPNRYEDHTCAAKRLSSMQR